MDNMDNINNTPEDISNRAQGHKANLSNPSTLPTFSLNLISLADGTLDTSEASKAHSKEVLDGMDKPFYSDEDQNVSKNPNQVAGGLKAAINNPQITQEGKDAAQQKLDNM